MDTNDRGERPRSEGEEPLERPVLLQRVPSLRRCWPMLTLGARRSLMGAPHAPLEERVRREIERADGIALRYDARLSARDAQFVIAQRGSRRAHIAAAARGSQGVILDPVDDRSWRVSDCALALDDARSVIAFVEADECGLEVIWLRGGDRRVVRYDDIETVVMRALSIVADEHTTGRDRPVPIASFPPIGAAS